MAFGALMVRLLLEDGPHPRTVGALFCYGMTRLTNLSKGNVSFNAYHGLNKCIVCARYVFTCSPIRLPNSDHFYNNNARDKIWSCNGVEQKISSNKKGNRLTCYNHGHKTFRREEKTIKSAPFY